MLTIRLPGKADIQIELLEIRVADADNRLGGGDFTVLGLRRQALHDGGGILGAPAQADDIAAHRHMRRECVVIEEARQARDFHMGLG